jgi:hypothetical protein
MGLASLSKPFNAAVVRELVEREVHWQSCEFAIAAL